MKKLAVTAASVAMIGLPMIATQADAAEVGPGSAITISNGDASTMCSLNSVARDEAGELYGITAGHCLSGERLGFEPAEIWADGELIADADGIAAGGHRHAGGSHPYQPLQPLNDFAWFKLADGVTDRGTASGAVSLTTNAVIDQHLTNFNSLINPDLAVTGYKDVSDLRPGQIVCKDGARTGRTCGPVVEVKPDTGEVAAFVPALSGDSGSALHVDNGDGTVSIVGTLSGGSPILFNIFDGTNQQINSVGLS